MKSDKMLYLYADIESLIKKNSWMSKQSRKFFNSRKRWAYSLSIFNVNNLGIWSHRKQTCFKLRKILYEKVSWSLREYTKNIIDFQNEKNVTIKKRTTKITSRFKSMLYLVKKNFFKSINYRKANAKHFFTVLFSCHI